LGIIQPSVPKMTSTAVQALCGPRRKSRSLCYLIEDARASSVLTSAEAKQLHALRRDVNRIKHDPTDVSERELRSFADVRLSLGMLRKLMAAAS
jgi:hypothetical protein